MKTIRVYSLLALILIALQACSPEYRFSIEVPKKVTFNDSFTISLKEKNGNPYEEVTFFINGKEVANNNGTLNISSKDYGVGKHVISAMVLFDGKSKRINNSVEILSNSTPSIYDFKIVNTYPHDNKAYTQGLEYHNGFLYESTGKNGMSSIRKVELKTGKVLKKIDIDKKYFGEGMTILNDKIYFLTWQSKKGFVYDLNTFELLNEFSYKRSKEGWGLTHSDTELIKSDGTNRIWFLDPKTQKEKRSIQAYHNKGTIDKLNELEFINGKIYANRWVTEKPIRSPIVIIDPTSGIVEGIISLDGLRDEILKVQKLEDDDVLNGIAFDAKNNKLYVTGKNWSKLFEIELIKRQ